MWIAYNISSNTISLIKLININRNNSKNEWTSCGAKAQQTPPPCCASRGFSELTKNVIRSSHGHSAPSLKISCKLVQPFSRNLAEKETKKERNRSKTIPRPRCIGGGVINITNTLISQMSDDPVWLEDAEPWQFLLANIMQQHSHIYSTAAAEALKKWDGGHSSMWKSLWKGLNPSPVLGIGGGR